MSVNDLAYDASPECYERQCHVTRSDVVGRHAVAYQHGDNPEAVILIDQLFSGTAEEAAARARRTFREFAERCHRYDDGEVAE